MNRLPTKIKEEKKGRVPNGEGVTYKTSKSWCITSHLVNAPVFDEKVHQLMVYQQEKGINPGKGQDGLHWQIYVKMLKTSGYRAVQKSLCKTEEYKQLNCNIAVGSPKQNRDYCSKSSTKVGKTFEFGNWPETGQGARNDIRAAGALAKEGKFKEIELDMLVKYHGGLDRVHREYFRTGMPYPRNVEVRWGAAGFGKTYGAAQDYNFEASLIKGLCTGKEKTPWFNGYNRGDEVAIIDDFDWENFPIGTLLDILDSYICQVQVKGGFVPWMPKTIIITSTVNPKDWYPGRRQPEVLRRINLITHITEHWRIRLAKEVAKEVVDKINYADNEEEAIKFVRQKTHEHITPTKVIPTETEDNVGDLTIEEIEEMLNGCKPESSSPPSS
uniref:Replication protein n=1 Tax=Cruciviridae sp. TaxID=1955495 RepID=A0A1S6LVI7_9VIRU|nr:replication protein [Cruciviridae sp.]